MGTLDLLQILLEKEGLHLCDDLETKQCVQNAVMCPISFGFYAKPHMQFDCGKEKGNMEEMLISRVLYSYVLSLPRFSLVTLSILVSFNFIGCIISMKALRNSTVTSAQTVEVSLSRRFWTESEEPIT
jgi:hypothetical protein